MIEKLFCIELADLQSVSASVWCSRSCQQGTPCSGSSSGGE